jgi:hypothetical protein
MKNRLSLITVFFLLLMMILGKMWKPHQQPISWDVAGYYLYLPATFIYDDPRMKDYDRFDSLRKNYQLSPTFYQVSRTPNNTTTIKYTMGSSILFAPFFFVGHAWAKLSGYPPDGFSYPYQQSLLLGTLLYGLLALLFARKILLHFFNDRISSLTLLMIMMGTNLFFIMSIDNLQSHYNLFFLYTLFIWTTIRFHQKPGWKRSIVLGITGGLIILTRPTDIVVGILPVLWGIQNWNDLKSKIKTHTKFLIVAGIIAGIVFFPQLFYWKISAGKWLLNSYDNPGEGLDLLYPHTLPFLFSYRKGWLIYTPLVIFMIAGIFAAIRKKEKVFIGLLLFFVINLWLVSSWTCWWYAASFSSRAMVQSYAVLMIPLGYFLQFISEKSKPISIGIKSFMMMLVLFCVFQTWQYSMGILANDRVTKAYYWRIFGATKSKPGDDRYLLREKWLGTDTVMEPQNFLVKREMILDWDNISSQEAELQSRLMKDTTEGGVVAIVDSSRTFFTFWEEPVTTLSDKYYSCVRVEGEVKNSSSFKDNPVELIRTIIHRWKAYGYNSMPLFAQDTSHYAGWRSFTYDYVLPDIRKGTDQFRAYFWLRGDQPVYVRNLKVKVLEPREFPELE